MATKFSYLDTGLTRESEGEVSIQSLIDTSDALAEEAREVLPYSFDECTYSKGYLRQSIWSCIDCGERGVCYGCSISCHAEHQLVELWTKRSFRCDCPTTSMASPTSKRCKITPPDQQPQLDNEENTYTHNFKGEFCRCGRIYDPETETEAMIQCIACEDWYHETCLNLRSGEQPEGDEEDDETRVLIPSDSYDGLICSACVMGNDYLKEKGGEEGWMMIKPDGDGYKVVGRPRSEVGDQAKDTGVKREREEESDEENKRLKLDAQEGKDQPTPLSDSSAVTGADVSHEAGRVGTKPSEPTASTMRSKGKGDIFLAEGVRDKLASTLDAQTIASLPFDLIDKEVYEPPQDNDEGKQSFDITGLADEIEETLDQVTNRVVEGLPRFQAIEALHGYQDMKERLMGMLRGHVANGETIRKEDIESFFAGLRRGGE